MDLGPDNGSGGWTMEHTVRQLLPALWQLRADGDVDDALRLVEAIHDLLAGNAGLGTAAVLVDVGEGFEAGPVAAPLGCFGTARMLYAHEEFPHGTGACDVLAAGVAAATGDDEQAVRLYELGLGLLDAGLDPGMVGRGWHNFGILLRRLGRPAESLEAQQRALAAYHATGEAVPTADCHAGMGIALHDLDRPADALEPYAAARALYLEFASEASVAQVDDWRGLALCDLGRYEEAAAAHTAATARYERLGEAYPAARSRRYRSHPLDHIGRREEAIAELEAARAVCADLDEPLEVARCDAGLGAALLGLGEEVAARALLDSARRALASFGEQDEADWCARVLADPTALAHNHP